MPRTIRINDSTTTLQLEAYLGVSCWYAKRCQRIIGDADHPSAWDVEHRNLDRLLDAWVERQAGRI